MIEFVGIPLVREVDLVLALCLASSKRLYLLRESCVLPNCIYPNPQWRFPMWEVLCKKLVEILLCEGGDVELGARTSKHILVFAFDPLSLTLSLSFILCLSLIHKVHSYLYAWY